jgi:hypothetical protein
MTPKLFIVVYNSGEEEDDDDDEGRVSRTSIENPHQTAGVVT